MSASALSLLACLTFSAGCSPLRALNVLVPSRGLVRTNGLAYGPLPRQALDVYRPQEAQRGLPVVVFFYGGRWQSGARAQYEFAAQALVSRGFVVAVADYRLYPEVVFPAFVEDAARAVAWVRRHIAEFGGDPERLFLMGHSAGAHIAMLLTLDEHYLADVGLEAGVLDGAVGLAGPYDFLPFTSPDIRALMGPEEAWPRTQPIHFAQGPAPPLLLLHGLDDDTVEPRNTLQLARRLRAQGQCVKVTLYPELGHVGLLLGLASPLAAFTPPVADRVAAFLRHPHAGCREAPRATEAR